LAEALAVSLVIASILLGVAPALAQESLKPVEISADVLKMERTAKPDAKWYQARNSAILELTQAAGNGKWQALGFEMEPRNTTLTPLDPLPEAVVHVEKLRDYDPARNPDELMRLSNRITFPLLSGNRVLMSITLAPRGSGWRTTSFGSAPLIRAVMRARLKLALLSGPGELLLPGKRANYRIVTVTALNQFFLAADGPSGLYLAPLFDVPHLGFTQGTPMRAREVFQKLLPAAKAFDGTPT
jgi:hypothetical protein